MRLSVRISARYVHLIDKESRWPWLGVKNLDWLGMKYTRWHFCLAVLLAATTLLAQTPTPYVATSGLALPTVSPSADTDQNDSVLTIRKRVSEVNVLFTATDRHGKFVRDLNQRDFTILDDHKPPQAIVNFRREVDLPLELGVLVDTSGSVRGRFDFEQEATVSFLQSTVRPKFDRAFVMGFSSHSQVTQDFTDNVPTAGNRSPQSARWRRDCALRCHLSRLPRQADQGQVRPSGAPRHYCGERWRGQPERIHPSAGN